jgi:PAS domain S-box-containing protein
MNETIAKAQSASVGLGQHDIEQKTQSELFNAVLDNMSQALCMFDAEGRLIVCNKLYASMYGLSPELTKPGTTLHQIIKHRIANGIYGEGDPEEYIRERLVRPTNTEKTNKVQRLSDGRFIQILTRPMPGGGWLATHEDISGRMQMEDALMESEARLRAIFDNTPLCINMKDTEGRYLLANKPYEEWWGHPFEDVIGKKAIEFQENRFGLQAMSVAEKLVLETGETQETEIRTKRPKDDGQIYDRLLIKFPVKSSDGKITAIGTVAFDITERKKVEKELIRHRDHLQELVDAATREVKVTAEELKEALTKERKLNELQRQFVSMASHEFRTPLTIIDGAAQRLKRRAHTDSLTSEDTLHRTDKIRDAVQRMTQLMESTLMAARMEEGKIKVDIGPCDIGKVVQEVCARHQDIAQTHVIAYELVDLPETIQADTSSIEQVLTNLLSNAVKYAPGAPDIEVMAATSGDQIVISVRDHGIGIDQDDLPSIGERFFRAKTSTGIAGTGIGLNLVKKLVEEHGGTASVESVKGEGSTFTIRLPVEGPVHSEQTAPLVA